jgi:hypothetical protein
VVNIVKVRLLVVSTTNWAVPIADERKHDVVTNKAAEKQEIVHPWVIFSSVGLSHFCHVRKINTPRIIPVHLTIVKKKMPPSRIKYCKNWPENQIINFIWPNISFFWTWNTILLKMLGSVGDVTLSAMSTSEISCWRSVEWGGYWEHLQRVTRQVYVAKLC